MTARVYVPKVVYCKNVSFIPNMANGRIRVDDSGIARIHDHTVRFRSGDAEDFDAMVLCTGFKSDFSLLRDVKIPENNVRYLYKHAFHPAHHGRLALIGFTRPFTGGIPICAEMQARYFALLCSGELKLPSDIEERITRDKEWEETFTEFSPRHVEAIPSQILFLDSIAKEIGCLPAARELLADPVLLAKLWCCSFNQASYRLTGRHSRRTQPDLRLAGRVTRGERYVCRVLSGDVILAGHHPSQRRGPPAVSVCLGTRDRKTGASVARDHGIARGKTLERRSKLETQSPL